MPVEDSALLALMGGAFAAGRQNETKEGAENRAFFHAGTHDSSIPIVAITVMVIVMVMVMVAISLPTLSILVPDFSGVAIPGEVFPGSGFVM
ncbi:MAG TPA: hypothetical protein PLE48_05855 [Thiobacillus sp.]|nr:hypothetical protein [Thiobacillus sp.]